MEKEKSAVEAIILSGHFKLFLPLKGGYCRVEMNPKGNYPQEFFKVFADKKLKLKNASFQFMRDGLQVLYADIEGSLI